MSYLGQALILAALAAAAVGAVFGMLAGRQGSSNLFAWTRRITFAFTAAMLLANLVMVVALLSHDFSVAYVTKVGSRSTPTWVTVVSLWSSLEGSILFWGAILGGYLTAFAHATRDRRADLAGYALGTMLLVGVFFAFLLAGPANPFTLVDPPPPDGPGPNALLQNHILMVLHPPSLYLGYVGMTVPFGMAMAAVLKGELGEGWVKSLRRWTMVPWMFLSFGIILGGWWAYEVLGWGGYWAWDPVENASFLPWLAATGYIHSTIVQERRQVLKFWTLLLVIIAFLLTILGTFMTRSGVFNSVHSFTQSAIGPTFLVFLAVAGIISLGLLAGRGHLLSGDGRFASILSRETWFLFNNVVLIVFTFMVLLGTIYPLITEAVTGSKLSVGEPYFNQMAVPLGLLLVFLMAVGPALPWGEPLPGAVLKTLAPSVGVGVLVAVLCAAAGVRELLPLFTFALCGMATVTTLQEMAAPVLSRRRERGEPFLTSLARAVSAARRRFGGYLVHLAVIAAVVAITTSHAYRQSAEASLAVGQSFTIGRYEVTLQGLEEGREPHRTSVAALLTIREGGRALGEMRPRLNFYDTQREPVGTPHVKTHGHQDLYLTLMSFEPDGSRAALKAFVNPLVAWLWWCLPVIGLGTLISLWPHRRARTESAA